MKNILTFDVEEWFHANYCDNIEYKPCNDTNIRKNMDRILELCREAGCKATFFILGCIAEKYPDMIRSIAGEGHDVASHGYAHKLAYNQTPEEFAEDVSISKKILEDITGQQVIGYRAPSWSIVEQNLNYLEILESKGYKYDASIFPTKTFLYGIPYAQRGVHKPQINDRELDMYEVPASVFDFFGRGIGYSGGFYFRFFPGCFIKSLIRKANRKGNPSVLYLHPREIDKEEKRLELGMKERFIHYYNISSTMKKLESVLRQFQFTSIKDFLNANHDANFKVV